MTEDTNESTDETGAQHDDQTTDATAMSTLSRRAALASLGVAGLSGLGTGTASGDPQGQVGTASDPLQTLYADAIDATDVTVDSLQLAEGSAGTPSLAFSDDADTGLYRPGAGTLAVGSDGTPGLTVDGAGGRLDVHNNDVVNAGSVSGFRLETDEIGGLGGSVRLRSDLDAMGKRIIGLDRIETDWIRSGIGGLTLTSNGRRALLLAEPDQVVADDVAGSEQPTPNLIGGHATNDTGGQEVVGATIGGGGQDGNENVVSSDYATVGGGEGNAASGEGSTVPGGDSNTASGDHSFAAGQYADSEDTNAFVWNDGSGESSSTGSDSDPFSSSTAVTNEAGEPVGSNTFTIKASEGVRFVTGDDFETIDYDPHYAWISRSGDVRASGGVNADGSVKAGKEVVADDFVSGPKLYTTDIAPSSGTADVGVQPDGQLVNMSSSSVRYKTNVEPLSTDSTDVLDLEPRSFEYEETGEDGVGLLAEEVDEAVSDLVLYDDDGRPDGVKYHRLGVFLLPEIRTNRESVEDLRDALEEKDDRIEDLEAESERKDARIADLEAETETLRKENDALREENERLRDRLDAIETHLGFDDSVGQQGVADD